MTSINMVIKKVLNDPIVKDFIINLNTQDQLFKQGIDANNRKLDDIGGDYSPLTIEGVLGHIVGKKERGLPFDHITLFDTGEFYTSFEVFVKASSFDIEADTIKDDGTDLIDRWGRDIIGLTQQSIDKLNKFILPRLQNATLEIAQDRLLQAFQKV